MINVLHILCLYKFSHRLKRLNKLMEMSQPLKALIDGAKPTESRIEFHPKN